MSDRRLKARDIAKSIGISTERVHHILTVDLDMKKLTARWVPRLLTVDQRPLSTPARFPCPKYTICGMRSLTTHLIRPTWPHVSFFLFPKLKTHLGGQKFSSDQEVKDAVSQFFADCDKHFFLNSMKGLEKRWTKCINLQGDFPEKMLFSYLGQGLIKPPSYV